jgi:hypothetical protein
MEFTLSPRKRACAGAGLSCSSDDAMRRAAGVLDFSAAVLSLRNDVPVSFSASSFVQVIDSDRKMPAGTGCAWLSVALAGPSRASAVPVPRKRDGSWRSPILEE